MQLEVPVLTPEKAIVSYQPAGLGARVVAHLIDLLIFGLIYFLFSFAVMLFGALSGMVGAATAPVTIAGSLGLFAYFILFEGLWSGQTLGKKVFGLRVRMADGTPITFRAALGRNLIRPADMLPPPYLLGFLAIFLNPKSQRLGDLVADTIVTYDRKVPPIFVAPPHRDGIHPLHDAVGDLAGMTRDEYEALRRFCDRYPDFTTTTQQKLIQELWEPFAERRNVPALPGVHPISLAEATVMKYGRQHGLL